LGILRLQLDAHWIIRLFRFWLLAARRVPLQVVKLDKGDIGSA
jgi:hypothetical protein